MTVFARILVGSFQFSSRSVCAWRVTSVNSSVMSLVTARTSRVGVSWDPTPYLDAAKSCCWSKVAEFLESLWTELANTFQTSVTHGKMDSDWGIHLLQVQQDDEFWRSQVCGYETLLLAAGHYPCNFSGFATLDAADRRKWVFQGP